MAIRFKKKNERRENTDRERLIITGGGGVS